MTPSADGLTIVLILLAALLHASWNALAKASSDPLVNLAVVTSTGGVLALPFLFLQPWPGAETWRWLGLSALLHYAYQLALVRMYRLGDLSQVYPIARGLAPLGVAGLAAVGAGESLAASQGIGLLLASGAIVVLGGAAGARFRAGAGVGTALLTAALIAAYTFSDGRGVRTVTQPLHYIAWSFFLGAVPFALTAVWLRGRTALAVLRRDGPLAVGGGLMATLGYGIALWALARAPMASVASLRESSVLFAALIGTRLLGEPFGRRRSLAAAILALGLVLIQMRVG